MAKNEAKVKEKKPKTTEEIYTKIYGMIEEAKSNSSTWAEKANDFYNLRMRNKKPKNFPFPGCSNLRLPTIETY